MKETRRFSIIATAAITLLSIGLFAPPASAAGNTYFVWTNGIPAPPYNTWETAFSNIQAAVDYASANDTVLVTNGLYTVTSSVTIAKAVTVRSVWGPANTTISLLRPTVTATVAMVTFSNAVLDGFTIQNGWSGASGLGGGVYVAYTGTVQNCVLVSNYAGNGAGAYVCTNGIVKNCRIFNNSNAVNGCGVYLMAGTATGCLVSNNVHIGSTSGNGIGIYLGHTASVVRNCLVQGNRASRGGGGIEMGNGLVENCTIVDNITGGYQGGGLRQSGGTVRNTIVWHNRNYWHQFPNWYKTGGTAEFCSSEDAPAGNSILATLPRFQDPDNRDYRLAADSPCRDMGTNVAWMGGATDLIGQDRNQGTAPDMGAFEFTTGPLQCGLWPDKAQGFDPCPIVLTATVDGTNTDSLYFRWDFENNGSIDREGFDAQIVTNSYGNGYWTPALFVSNAAGEVAVQARLNLIRVGPETLYVVMTNTLAAPPYTNWANAGTNIQAVIDWGVDGSTVWVSNGLYNKQTILLTNAVTVRSVNGAAATTVIKPTSGTPFGVGIPVVRDEGHNPGGVIQGFTLTGSGGAGVNLYGGSLIDSVVSNFSGAAATYCFLVNQGAYASGCLIVSNTSHRTGTGEVGDRVNTAFGRTSLVERCVFRKNVRNTAYESGYPSAVAGVAVLAGGWVRDCLFIDNLDITSRWCSAYLSGGLLENCTFINNIAAHPTNGAVGGFYINAAAATVRNCMFWGNSNRVTGSTADYIRETGGKIEYSRLTPSADAFGSGNITADPIFVNAATGNYYLTSSSPGFNAGTNSDWMATAVDLNGNSRLLGAKVDMGCYETVQPRKGTLLLIR